MKTITVKVEIGKSRKLTTFIFPAEKFQYIKDNQIYIKGEEERMRISDEQISQVVFQLELDVKQEIEPTAKTLLRDKIAISALNGLVNALYSTPESHGWSHFSFAVEAYGLADEMIKQRNL